MHNSFLTPGWLVQHITWNALRRAIAAHAHGLLIDLGCGVKPYATLTRGAVRRHVGIDIPACLHGASHVDLFARGSELPLHKQSVDTVLATAVLEHVEEPLIALKEIHTALKPGGTLIGTAPFIWHIHEDPRDFYRYTSYGLEYLLREAGFEILQIAPLSGFWVTFASEAAYTVHRADKGWLRRTRIIPLTAFAIQIAGLTLDRLDRSERWTWAYLFIAKAKHDTISDSRA